MGDPPSANTAHSDDARPSCPLSSNELRRLVLDYLCQHCFIDTAKAFVKDWPREGDDQVGGGDYSNAGVGSTSSNGGNASGSGSGIVGGLKQDYEGTNGVGGSSISGSGVRIMDSGSITASTGSQADDVRHTAGVENGQASENGSRVEGGSFDHDGDAEMEIAGEGDEEDGEEEFFDDDAVMNTSELNGSRLSLNGKSSKGRAGESDEEDLPDLRNETIRRIRIRKGMFPFVPSLSQRCILGSLTFGSLQRSRHAFKPDGYKLLSISATNISRVCCISHHPSYRRPQHRVWGGNRLLVRGSSPSGRNHLLWVLLGEASPVLYPVPGSVRVAVVH